MKTLVICSGGLDSVTLARKVTAEQTLTRFLSFDYGQRHKKELDSAWACAGRALCGRHDAGHRRAKPQHHHAGMAFGVAAAKQAEAVAAAVHGGDHFIYPDCGPEFIGSFETMQRHALEGLASITLYAPFVQQSKADIVREGVRLNVTFADTCSCYQGGQRQCGRCSTCVERHKALHLAQVDDPTAYEDPDYWFEACRAHQAKQPS